MNNKPLWDVGETVKEKKEESPFMIKTCPFRKREYGYDVCCNEAKCGLWSNVGGACAFVVIANGIYGG